MERRNILIVDDNKLNRQYLRGILEMDYEILEAENGQLALDILEREHEEISGILLDIIMPVMDGFTLLKTIREDERLLDIPIIVVTEHENDREEKQALALGANDFVHKPFDPDSIRHRLANTIRLRETASALKLMRRDKLTGLLNRETFFEKAASEISAHEPGYFLMAVFDIDNFKRINETYGQAEGDRVLKLIAEAARAEIAEIGGFISRITADNFAAIYPAQYGRIDFFRKLDLSGFPLDEINSIRNVSTGLYVIRDRSLHLNTVYDRAYIAKRSIKNRYDIHEAYYEENMNDRLLHEQNISLDMKGALEKHEFEAWYQPQYNHSSGALVGAEALVRWRHPQKGLIPPGDFIPIFERNGFIYELDKYMWEEVCFFIRQRLDAGEDTLPISVNISRHDLFRDDLVSVISDMALRYRIPRGKLNLEITESAFANSAEQVISVVKELMDLGFTVEIDDFGSGFSSLNTLKDVPADVLKLDMRFLESSNSLRGGNIVESIVRMAKWLNMTVIAEGVETVEQADFLKSVGCNYVQGYLYSRPIPADEYIELASNSEKEERLIRLKTVRNLDTNTFWDPNSMETLIFNSYVGGACIFEYHNGKFEMLRSNDKFSEEFFGSSDHGNSMTNLDLSKHMDAESMSILRENILHAIESNDESTCVTKLHGVSATGGNSWIRSTVRVIAQADENYLLYSSISNITAQREAEEATRASAEIMHNMMSDMPGGLVRMRIYPDGTARPDYVNKGFCSLIGLERDEIMRRYIEAPMWDVHPDDVDIANEAHQVMIESGETGRTKYRLRRGNGEYIRLTISGRATTDPDGSTYLNVYYADDSEADRREELRKSLLDNLPCGAGLYLLSGKDLKVIHLNQRFKQMVDRVIDDQSGTLPAFSAVHPDDIVMLRNEIGKRVRSEANEASLACDVRIRKGASGYADFHVLGRGIKQPDLSWAIYVTFTPVSDAEISLKLLTNSIPGGIARYEITPRSIRILYFSDGFYNSTGYSRDEYQRIAEQDPTGLIFTEDIPGVMEVVDQILRSQNDTFSYEYRAHSKDGSYAWININGLVAERHGSTVIANIIKMDVSDQKKKDDKLRIHEEEMKLAMEQMGKMICEYDPVTHIMTVPDSFAILKGTPSVRYNMPQSRLEELEKTGKHESAEKLKQFYAEIEAGESSGFAEFDAVYADGETHWERGIFYTIFDAENQPAKVIITVEDITEAHEKEEERLEMERRLKQKAEHDALTDLLNRSTLEELANMRISTERKVPLALLLIDLDDLKRINDLLGHDQGDQALKKIAQLLETHFRRDDLIGRIGGDEFVVFLNNCGDQAWMTKSMTKFLKRTTKLRAGEHDDLPLKCSIGIAFGNSDTDTYDSLLKKADRALYHVKRNGKDDYAFYTPEMEEDFFSYNGHFDREEKARELNLSIREAEIMIQDLKLVFDLVRLVDPEEMKVLRYSDNSSQTEQKQESCYSILGREGRCENCSSRRALEGRTRCNTYENCGDKLYHVLSKYVEINGRPFVIEAISDVSGQRGDPLLTPLRGVVLPEGEA